MKVIQHGTDGAAEALRVIGQQGESAAFPDIHHHSAGPADLTPAPALGKGGSAAFLCIHCHGRSITGAVVKGMPGLHIGDAALLDIHHHG